MVIFVLPHTDWDCLKFMVAFFALATLMSFVLAQKSHPGYLELVKEDPERVIRLLRKFNPKRICPWCIQIQSKGVSHCSACNRCVSKYDSHSYMVNNCITQYNRIFYICFLFSIFFFFLVLLIISISRKCTFTPHRLSFIDFKGTSSFRMDEEFNSGKYEQI